MTTARVRLQIRGLVQGVGFRPWVVQRARSLGLSGHVRNVGQGVEVVAAGDTRQLNALQHALRGGGPSGADIHHMTTHAMPSRVDELPGEFSIAPSCAAEPGALAIPRDQRPCSSCLNELRGVNNRRYRYPFISCAECGPRFTILDAMPFDRERTSMAAFALCDACGREYADPSDRRCHAQTIACEQCGPQLWLVTAEATVAGNAAALQSALGILQRGGVLAMKGVGGYQLLAAAHHDAAVRRLRAWKQRQRKPLAVMLPDLQAVSAVCEVSAAERAALNASAAPIVILQVSSRRRVSHLLAPGLDSLGVMLPASPLHQLLADDMDTMLVVTSANRRGEPLITDDDTAFEELLGVADGVLGHNRVIARMADDSVMRLADDRPIVMRHARGLAPTSIPVAPNLPAGIAFGGHMKAAAALCRGGSITLLQHVGDLQGIAAQERLTQAAEAFPAHPRWLASDAHPDYASTWLAQKAAVNMGLAHHTVFHHVAHVLAVAAEHQLTCPLLGVAFDGTGLGADGRIWGGEFIAVHGWQHNTADAAQPGWRRVGSVLDFPLPGGDAAIREPRRAALGLAWRLCEGNPQQIPDCIRQMFTPAEWDTLLSMLQRGFNCPGSSSMGRLFDALAACLGLARFADYDGEAAMLLEAAAQRVPPGGNGEGPTVRAPDIRHGVWDWRGVVADLLEQIEQGCDAATVAAGWHDSVAQMILHMVRASGLATVVLCGGVFQNARLLSRSRSLLQHAGIQVYCHQQLPANDGSLAVGQALAAAHTGLQAAEDCAACV